MFDIHSISELHDELKIDAFMANTSNFMMLIDCYSTDAYFVIILQKTIALAGWLHGQPALCPLNS
jgi:hypothetical protein